MMHSRESLQYLERMHWKKWSRNQTSVNVWLSRFTLASLRWQRSSDATTRSCLRRTSRWSQSSQPQVLCATSVTKIFVTCWSDPKCPWSGAPKGNKLVSRNVTRVEGLAWCASTALIPPKHTNATRPVNCGGSRPQLIVAPRTSSTSSAASAARTSSMWERLQGELRIGSTSTEATSWPKTKKHQPDLISIQQDTVLRTWSWSPSREWDLLTILTPASVVRSIGSTGIKLWHSEPISKNRASSTRGTCMDISELPYANCNLKIFSP